MKLKYEWKEWNSDIQHYFETKVNGVYMCVFANKWNPDIYMGMIDKEGFRIIYGKTRNDRVRKKMGLPKNCSVSALKTHYILCNSNPEYMMKKVEYCFDHGITEVSA